MASGLEKHSPVAPVSLDFHLVEPEGNATTKEMPLAGTRLSLHLRKEPALSLRDLKSALATKDAAGKDQVLLFLKPRGTAKLEKVTGDNVGRKLAIVLDGKLVLAPEIKTKMVADKLFLGLDLSSEEEAKRLADRLTAAAGHR